MQTTILKHSAKGTNYKYPCLLIHTGSTHGGDPDWEDVVILATFSNKGIVMHIPDFDLITDCLLGVVAGLNCTADHWKPFQGILTVDTEEK